ncbi:MAG TPA: hypothetical protein VFH51_20040 [Myxococcota bacterium]|nr:hypothetical protein [Myxococcota bacterium]
MEAADRGPAAARQRVRPHEGALDAIYARYEDSDPFMPNGFIDHATMGAEALVALGLGPHVETWLTSHPVRRATLPATGEPLEATWEAALGHDDRHGDWLAHFQVEVTRAPHADVLQRWVPRLLQDVGARLFHGLLRTAHAVRALDHRDTPARRSELAHGLALWASGVSVHPEDAASGRGPLPAEALLRHARGGAEVFLRAPNVPTLHLVTGPMAYMLLAPHLPAEAHALADVAFTRVRQTLPELLARMRPPRFTGEAFDEAHLEALAHVADAHPAKLTEACLRAFRATHDDIFLAAAAKVQPEPAWEDVPTLH